MKIDYQGKTAVVTGAGGFIGTASAKLFAELGANVVAADVDEASLQTTVDAITAAGGTVTPAVADLTDAEQVESIIDTAIETYGKVDVLFNNAGGMFPTPMSEVDKPAYDHVMRLNVDAVYHASRKAVGHMVDNGGGVIINTTSGAGSGAVNGLAAYGAAKAGVNALTRSLAIEYGRQGVRANAIAPSAAAPMMLEYLDTLPGGRDSFVEAQPMDRIGTAEEMAYVAAFLGSDYASFVNGVVIPVDGGIEALLPTSQ